MPLPFTGLTRMSPGFPEHAEYMAIYPEVGRIICAHALRRQPGFLPNPACYSEEGWHFDYLPMALSYVEVEEGLIKIQIHPWNDWKEHRYFVEGDILHWDDKRDDPWQILSPDQFPHWFQTLQERAQAGMDRRAAAYLERDENDPKWAFLKSNNARQQDDAGTSAT